MLSSKTEARKRLSEDSGSSRKLKHEIDTISKALYLDKSRSKSSVSTAFGSRSKPVGKPNLPESKTKKINEGNEDNTIAKDKKSIWNWKPLKAFTNVRNRRFNCNFTLEVHSIEGLPSYFEGLNLRVHWKRRDGELETRPARVTRGIADFGDQLKHVCSVYGSRNGPHHSAKYEAKHFLLYAAVSRGPELDLGKHRVDLTRLLPLTLEELEDEKSTGKWTTSYRLSGKAKGATLNVSFGYSVIGDNSVAPQVSSVKDASEMLNFRRHNTSELKIRRAGSLPSLSVEDIKDLHEVIPLSRSELSTSIDLLYQKLDEESLQMEIASEAKVIDLSESTACLEPNAHVSDFIKENAGKAAEDGEFSVTEYGIEWSSREPDMSGQIYTDNCSALDIQLQDDAIEKPVNTTNALIMEVGGITNSECDLAALDIPLQNDSKATSLDEKPDNTTDGFVASDKITEVEKLCSKEMLMKDLEIALSNMSDLTLGMDSPSGLQDAEDFLDVKSNNEISRTVRSLSFDDTTDCIAGEFLDMLGIEHSPLRLSSESEPESPRERLLRQFEKDILDSGCSLFDFDGYADDIVGSEEHDDFYEEDMDLLSEIELAIDNSEPMIQKTRASILEDLETEELMREWGLNDDVFKGSPPDNLGGFGSPIKLPPQELQQLPPLEEGLGPFVQTKDGGFLRSMNPAIFRNAKSNGRLVMQVSNPVVVPAQMGSTINDVLQHMASVGIEKLSMQANTLMPLEDITGMTMQQIAWEENTSTLEPTDRQTPLQQENECFRESRAEDRSRSCKMDYRGKEMDSEYVSLEDLAPLAMDKIEALSIEGLRIQSGMSDEEGSANISSQSIGQISTLEGKRGIEGSGGLQLLDIKDSNDDIDGLMGLSLTLDEWMRLDSGDVYDEDQISERTSKILAAHQASSLELIRGRSRGEKRRGKSSRCGIMGNNFTVALMVQLRDPSRNYEPVGTPMLALIQVERVFVPPKMKIFNTVVELKERNKSRPTKVGEVKEEPKQEEENHEEETIPKFKIAEVHVAGLKIDQGKKKLWGSSSQQQSGSRWLLANGMGKGNKQTFMKSKPPMSVAKTGDTLWSFSSRFKAKN
ncbi:protein PLASTID MOVEMENT IMPAIRED 1-RELATED 1-like [Impatiens glandulifera]|uniref:protein PLASTID MOVEMENT IMPAIRED 1-RELATED 1-like n=1 Tax=Impatiens glandulifera TaxID=253017 RepID=UPI001FB17C5A|nr:protein PLASTID MOVEMENT IMPAIRED 1-RELATED 1-like [Impatiens glandulifera]